jgi:hypothetical protein
LVIAWKPLPLETPVAARAPAAGLAAAAAKFIAEETQLWGRVIKEAHITLE